jgi:hypothetical protein
LVFGLKYSYWSRFRNPAKGSRSKGFQICRLPFAVHCVFPIWDSSIIQSVICENMEHNKDDAWLYAQGDNKPNSYD